MLPVGDHRITPGALPANFNLTSFDESVANGFEYDKQFTMQQAAAIEARKRAAARAVQILNLTERASESSTVLGRTQTIVEWLHN